MRRYVIGDIHGCSQALHGLIEEISPRAEDQLIFLGDFIDRGPDSRGVVDQVIELARRTRVVALRGNHEVMLMGVIQGGLDVNWWRETGGQSTLASYGGSLARLPSSHFDFFQSLRSHYETKHEIFIHAGYDPSCPIEHTRDLQRYWNHLRSLPPPHCSGKRVYVGHTPQASGEVLNLGHLICVDTYCFGGGWLTAMDVDSHEILQASRQGQLRRPPTAAFMKWIERLLPRGPRRSRSAAAAERGDCHEVAAGETAASRQGR